MPPQIFRNRVIAAAGPLPGQFTTDNLKQWSKLRKGVFTEEFEENVTHLLCTREQFDDRVPRIRRGLKRKGLHIVHYDWFEFSAVKDKRQPEWEYSMRAVLAQERAERREWEKLERGKKEGERAVNSNLFHIYRDRELFSYQIVINRDDLDEGATGQRYILYLWESNARPHLYWFVAKYLRRKSDSQPTFYRPSSCSGKWREQMNYFMDFFHTKTGIEWQDRVLKQKTMPARFFQYQPPTGGKPVGRRLRFTYDYCMEVNAQMRGLPSQMSDPAVLLESKEPFTHAGNTDEPADNNAGRIEDNNEVAREDEECEPSFELYQFDFEETQAALTGQIEEL